MNNSFSTNSDSNSLKEFTSPATSSQYPIDIRKLYNRTGLSKAHVTEWSFKQINKFQFIYGKDYVKVFYKNLDKEVQKQLSLKEKYTWILNETAANTLLRFIKDQEMLRSINPTNILGRSQQTSNEKTSNGKVDTQNLIGSDINKEFLPIDNSIIIDTPYDIQATTTSIVNNLESMMKSLSNIEKNSDKALIVEKFLLDKDSSSLNLLKGIYRHLVNIDEKMTLMQQQIVQISSGAMNHTKNVIESNQHFGNELDSVEKSKRLTKNNLHKNIMPQNNVVDSVKSDSKQQVKIIY